MKQNRKNIGIFLYYLVLGILFVLKFLWCMDMMRIHLYHELLFFELFKYYKKIRMIYYR